MKSLIVLVIFLIGTATGALIAAKERIPIPVSYEEAYYLSAILAVIVGGAWAVTTWIHQERRRKARDIPGIEMDIQFSESPMTSSRVFLTIDVVVVNTSDVPILPVIKKVSLSIERIEVPKATGFLPNAKSDDGRETRLVAPDLSELTLEPHTRTVFSEFLVAESGHLYAAFFHMPSQFKTGDGIPWFWEKRRIYYVAGNGSWKTQSASQAIQPTAGCSDT